MTSALKPAVPPVQAVDRLAARVEALASCRDRYQAQIAAILAVLELAQAQGDEAESERALVELTLACAARTLAVQHLERLSPATHTPETSR